MTDTDTPTAKPKRPQAVPKRMGFTQLAVERLRPETGDVIWWDQNLAGFGVRVSSKGKKTWLVQYRYRTEEGKLKERQAAIGGLAFMTLKQARERAQELKRKASTGIDPVEELKATQRVAEAHRAAEQFTFRKLVDRFATEYADRQIKASSANEIKRRLYRWCEVIGNRPVKDIRKQDLVSFLNDHLASRSGKGYIEANNLLSSIRHLFNWARKRDLIEINVATDVAKPLNRVPTRDRYLDDDEIKRFWLACNQVGWPAGQIFQLLLLTGARKNEVAQMTWNELDLNNRVWNLPASRTKNSKAHTTHLSGLAVEIFQSLPRVNGSDFVFTMTGAVPFSGFAYAKDRVAELMGDSPNSPLTKSGFVDSV